MFQNSNPGLAEVCLNRPSSGAAAREFALFLRIHFAQEIACDIGCVENLGDHLKSASHDHPETGQIEAVRD